MIKQLMYKKKKKWLFHLVLLFIVAFILKKAIIENICELLRWKAHNFATLKL